MARIVQNQLTALKVRKATKPGRYCDGLGLYLQIVSRDNRSWLFRYMRDGAAHEMGIGPTHSLSLEEAREKVRRLRQQLLEGLDPLAERKKARMAALAERAKLVTFKQVAEDYLKLHLDSFKNPKHRAQWRST